jgi:hypothetical protein
VPIAALVTRAAPFDQLEHLPAEADAVVRWRFETLLHAGYDAGSALILAGHLEVDLHEAIRLVERGCPPPLALQITL